jgi:hypothetical protein
MVGFFARPAAPWSASVALPGRQSPSPKEHLRCGSCPAPVHGTAPGMDSPRVPRWWSAEPAESKGQVRPSSPKHRHHAVAFLDQTHADHYLPVPARTTASPAAPWTSSYGTSAPAVPAARTADPAGSASTAGDRHGVVQGCEVQRGPVGKRKLGAEPGGEADEARPRRGSASRPAETTQCCSLTTRRWAFEATIVSMSSPAGAVRPMAAQMVSSSSARVAVSRSRHTDS